MKAFLLAVVLLAGCSMGADEATMRTRGMFHCVDLRDGETFDYDAATIRDVRVGLFGAPSTGTITDTTGRTRYGSSDQNTYLKCSSVGKDGGR